MIEKDIEINGQILHYRESGPADGTPALLMHGWGCDRTTLASVAAVLDKKMRVISVDFPGHGLSPEPDGIWGVEEYTSLIEQFIKKLDLKNPMLLGHSFGGRVGILYASRHDDVSKLVLVDAAGVKPKRPLSYHIRVGSFKAAKRIAPVLFGKKRGNAMIENWRRRKGSADYAAASPRMRAILSRVVNEDLRGVMPAIKASTLLIWGANDTATPVADAKVMERLIPDAGLVVFPAAGHYSFLDASGAFGSVLKSFMKSELK